jgi:hypothetical protein
MHFNTLALKFHEAEDGMSEYLDCKGEKAKRLKRFHGRQHRGLHKSMSDFEGEQGKGGRVVENINAIPY